MDRRTAIDAARMRRIETLTRSLLRALGEDPDREGLTGTPHRVARWWREFLGGAAHGDVDVTFELASTSQLVSVRGIRVWSICEHHLLPFSCDLYIGYVPAGRVIGLSKITRIARRHAAQLQLQERLVAGVADELERVVRAPDVAVVGRGAHFCMLMRGVRQPALVVTSELRGRFRSDAELRGELFAVLRTADPARHAWPDDEARSGSGS